ncbi:LPXTG cell wall anchor domain-containing protein [Streptomyces sp. CRN 30]|uniref:LPXTG cell wall anchor domain-containing protein n=1 Tax=Streptomyces sp. CRN 30 TaxID=3075613 RepID=UPI002A7FB157|nr:LPXTG cell wall anchor domain-containing protein [Streptomyces sp. CRN 30]
MSLSHRLPLRAAVVTLGVTGAVLLPTTGALATDDPTRAPSAAPSEATEAKPEPTTAPEDGADRTDRAEEVEAAEPAEDNGPTRAPQQGEIPRGGVAAGERPATDSNTTLYGTAAGTVLLAGAGTYVLRRRAGAQRNG